MKIFNLSILVLATAVLLNGFLNSSEMENKALATLDAQSIKRIDELNGDFQRGEKRFIEVKAPKVEKAPKAIVAEVKKTEVKREVRRVIREYKLTEPAIRNDVDLQLVEYYNPNGAGKVLYQDQIEGQLVVRSGEITDLSFSLDENSQIRLDSDEFKGNSFAYYAEGERFEGQVYPISRTSYMLTLTNGPHSGVRMKFQDPNSIFKKPASVESNDKFNEDDNFSDDEYGDDYQEERVAEVEHISPGFSF